MTGPFLKKIFLIAMLLALTACGRLSVQPTEPTSPGVDQVDELRTRFSTELESFGVDTRETAGIPSATDCDGVLWAGEACAGGVDVKISAFEYSPGEIGRRPAATCWKDGKNLGADTTISRDGLTGYMRCLWDRQDLDGLKRLADYGEKHAFVMGEPLADGRVVLGPNLTGTLGRMIYALSDGADDRSYSLLFEAYPPALEDSAQHIQALGITLQGDVVADIKARGLSVDVSAIALLDISPGMKARLEELVQAHPDDYLFQEALAEYTGDFAETVRLLMANPPPPTYVRGDRADLFERARWLYVAKRVLARFPPSIGSL
jgi:hypothetical protein